MRRFPVIFMAFAVQTAVSAQGYSSLTNENHPRLLLNEAKMDSIRVAVESHGNEVVMKLDSLVIHLADSISTKGENLNYIMDDSGKRILQQSRKALENIFCCSYAYRRTGNDKYKDKAVRDLMEVCSFPDWNPSHFLDIGEMAAAAGIGYDWLYHYLTQEEKKIIREALMEKAFKPAGDDTLNWFYYNEGNWNQVCNSGLTVAALAVFEECRDTARDIIEEAVRTNRTVLERIYGNEGNYAEGPGYWRYGTMFQTLMLSSLETALGTDFGLSENAGFMNTPNYILLSEGAVHQAFNYSDNVSTVVPNYPLWYFADRLSNPSALFNEMKILKEGDYTASDCRRLLPLLLLYASEMDESGIKPPEIHYFVGNGTAPVMMYRGDWSSTEDDVFLGFKGGTPNSTHSHMDGGSFIFDFKGIRWSMDLDRQDYGSLEKPVAEMGGDIWDLSGTSFRWKLFRINNRQHSTLTINDHDHYHKGKAKLTDTVNTEGRHGATMDMSELFSGELLSASRSLVYTDGRGLAITDSIETLRERPAVVRWTMVTPADPEIIPDGILLHAEGKAMLLKASCTEGQITYKFWSSDPKAYSSATASFEDACPHIWIVGFETTVPEGKQAIIRTSLNEFLIEK